MQYKKIGKNSDPRLYIPKIGDGNKMILESWYFALWAYNSWSKINNPHIRKNMSNDNITYQDKIYKVIKKEFGIEVATINIEKLKNSSLPEPTASFEYPATKNYSFLVRKGDYDIFGQYVLKGETKKYIAHHLTKYIEMID